MKRTIKKALEELNKESPRLDYIRGMLEVLIDEDDLLKLFVPEGILDVAKQVVSKNGGGFINNEKVDEEFIPEIAKAGPIGRIA